VSDATVELAMGPAHPWFHHLEVGVGKLAGAGLEMGLARRLVRVVQCL
jgi:hypothetical protein